MRRQRTLSNQSEMVYQARCKAFMIEHHPCKRDCPDRNATCKLSCEKLKAFDVEFAKFKTQAFTEKQKVQRLDTHAATAARINTERT